MEKDMSTRRVLRRILIFASVLIMVTLRAATLAQSACDACLGEWFSPDKDGKFLFYKSNGTYYGKLIWVKETVDEYGKTKTDSKNPDPSKRNVPMLGLVIFKNFVWDSEESEWVNGTVYDARHGDTYSCKMSMSGKLVLEVRGYILVSWLGKSAYFTRY